MVEGGGYVTMSGVRLPPEMTSQLTTFIPWKCAKSTLQPWGWYLATSLATPYAPPAVVVIASEHTSSYPNLLR